MLRAIVITSLIWAIEAASYYFFCIAAWRGMTVGIALIFVVVVNFASLIALTMGGIGSIGAAAPAFLVVRGYTVIL
jgi:uncharacterized membrane protein YbhN (UPF0104 family)